MLALRIALRYLRAPKSHHAVNVIAGVAVAGVCVAVAAMVVVLSVFNGFANLAAQQLSRLDAPLRVSRVDGRVVESSDSLVRAISTADGVGSVVPVLEGRALLGNDAAQTAVMMKGVPAGYDAHSDISETFVDGVYAEATNDGTPAVQIAVGVSNDLLQRPDAEQTVTLYTPRRVGRINPANPSAAFLTGQVAVSGVFSIGHDVDNNLIIVPIDVARRLMEYPEGASAVEVTPAPGTGIDALAKSLQTTLGKDYVVADRLQQRATAFRMISIEKWITFMLIAFVLLIAMFNIVATLSMLAIEKRSNMNTLRALGASQGLVRRIFATLGALVTWLGGGIGIVLGAVLVLMQQEWHLIKMGADPSQLAIPYYPVALSVTDLVGVAGAVAVASVLAAVSTTLMRKT